MNEAAIIDVAEARRRFDERCAGLRVDLHRFCTRMTGSPCDGEDVVQDALVLAFYKLSELREGASFRSWLFRIAHNKCIDFLRASKRLEPLDERDEEPLKEAPMDEKLDSKLRALHTIERIVTDLPPKERACVVLKDVLDCSLEETAEITGSPVGAVKAALHRGREKLARVDDSGSQAVRTKTLSPAHRTLVERYLAAFNRRDWAGVQALLGEDAQLEVVHRFEGPFRDASYFTNYGRLAWEWKLQIAVVDGVEAIVHYRKREGAEGSAWVPHSVVQIGIENGAVTFVRDYVHVDYLLEHSEVVVS